MFVGEAVWQDFVLGDMEPSLAGVVTITPVTGYDFPWWLMVERQIRAHGGRSCYYTPRTPQGYFGTILGQTIICNLMDIRGEDGAGNVRILGKKGVIAAREWFTRGFVSRPQRGDKIESGSETFYVEEAEAVERLAPDGVVRDLKFRLELSGASHRR